MELKQSLAWETDKEAFSRAVRENFGQFSEDRSTKLSKEQIRSPRLLVSEHGMNSKVIISIASKSGMLCTLTWSAGAPLVMFSVTRFLPNLTNTNPVTSFCTKSSD